MGFVFIVIFVIYPANRKKINNSLLIHTYERACNVCGTNVKSKSNVKLHIKQTLLFILKN